MPLIEEGVFVFLSRSYPYRNVDKFIFPVCSIIDFIKEIEMGACIAFLIECWMMEHFADYFFFVFNFRNSLVGWNNENDWCTFAEA